MTDLDRTFDRKLAVTVAEGGRLRALVLELWQRTRMDWGFVTDRLATTFRKETWIGARDRRFVSETLYGIVRNLRRIDLAIELGVDGWQGRWPDTRAPGKHPATRSARSPRDIERLIVLLVLEGLLELARAERALPQLHWPAVASVDEAIAAERDPIARLALAYSLPDWLARRLVADWGDQAEPLARSLNERAPMTIRANTLVGTRDALVSELDRAGLATHPGHWCDTALVVDSRTNLFGLDAFKAGALEAQDEGSQLLAELAIPESAKPLVVDYCAGAGGKTLAIAAKLGNRGRIVATDVDGHKLEELRRRARRAKVSNTRAMTIDDPELDALHGKADVVLIDAPCSGIGALRRNPEARWRLREDELAGFAARQLQIIAAAKQLCAPAGRLVYATCSLLRAENAAVVAAVLEAHPDLRQVPLRDVVGDARATTLGDGETFTVAPHTHGTDGFFAACFRRT